MDQKVFLAETLKSMERIEQAIVDEIRRAREDNEPLIEALGEARIAILKISYKFNMDRAKQGLCRRGAGGSRRGSRADRGGASGDRLGEEHIERRAMFGRRAGDTNSHSISESRSSRPMFGQR